MGTEVSSINPDHSSFPSIWASSISPSRCSDVTLLLQTYANTLSRSLGDSSGCEWSQPRKEGVAKYWGNSKFTQVTQLCCWLRRQRIHLQCGRPGFNPRAGKIPWRRAWQPTPVFLPGESHREEPGRLESMGSQRVRHD